MDVRGPRTAPTNQGSPRPPTEAPIGLIKKYISQFFISVLPQLLPSILILLILPPVSSSCSPSFPPRHDILLFLYPLLFRHIYDLWLDLIETPSLGTKELQAAATLQSLLRARLRRTKYRRSQQATDAAHQGAAGQVCVLSVSITSLHMVCT